MEHFILMSAVKPTKKTTDKAIQDDLKKLISVINKLHKETFITELDMVMPFEFQGITNNLVASLNILFDIEECIIENKLEFKLKHVLYHDKIKSLQSKHEAYERLGFGLIDARKNLDLIKKSDSRFLIITGNEKKSLHLNNLLMIYEDYLDSWRLKDYDFVNAFLSNMSYKEVAQQFNINISNGWRKERNLKMKQYYTIKEMILTAGE